MCIYLVNACTTIVIRLFVSITGAASDDDYGDGGDDDGDDDGDDGDGPIIMMQWFELLAAQIYCGCALEPPEPHFNDISCQQQGFPNRILSHEF